MDAIAIGKRSQRSLEDGASLTPCLCRGGALRSIRTTGLPSSDEKQGRIKAWIKHAKY
ncbi:hypothetical protein [Xanthomonas vasicola]|uniref:hypothetical protein n=1 Tax=Xanthomonas vasicola TaxID=56459 RepID=UPI001C97AD67|nr:hypothetical protein [Xanthomonas vasicola]